jgi:anti-sigma factor RsiW
LTLLTDEILNKYLDGELDAQKFEEVEDILRQSDTERKRFNALKLIHEQLSLVQEEEVPEDFTSFVMAKIGKKFAVPRQQKYFILSIISLISLFCLGIVVYVAIAVISSATPQTETIQVTETVQQIGNRLIEEIVKMFSGKNLSIIGSIFSLGILISGYFFFERQKQAKANLSA